MIQVFFYIAVGLNFVLVMLLTLLLLFSQSLPESTLLYITQPGNDHISHLYIHHLNTGVRYPLFELLGWGADAAWSPDGSQIAFTTFQQNLAQRLLYVYDLKSRTAQEIHTGLFDVNSPSWSPDGFALVMQGIRVSNQWDLYRYEFATDKTTLLYQSQGIDGRPVWSPDGEQIIFESNYYSMSSTDIVVFSLETNQVTALTSGFTSSIAPIWSPDGGRIAFTAVTERGSYDLFTMNANSRSLFRLPGFPGGVMDPSWSSDGHWISFSARGLGDHGYLHIYTIPANGNGEPRRITQGNQGYVQPHWRP